MKLGDKAAFDDAIDDRVRESPRPLNGVVAVVFEHREGFRDGCAPSTKVTCSRLATNRVRSLNASIACTSEDVAGNWYVANPVRTAQNTSPHHSARCTITMSGCQS